MQNKNKTKNFFYFLVINKIQVVTLEMKLSEEQIAFNTVSEQIAFNTVSVYKSIITFYVIYLYLAETSQYFIINYIHNNKRIFQLLQNLQY